MLIKVSIVKLLELAITIEQKGADYYAGMAESFSGNKDVFPLFQVLAGDETRHKGQFEALYTNNEHYVSADINPNQLLLAEAMSRPFAQASDSLFGNAAKIETRVQALEIALNVETRTLGFYQALQDLLDEKEILPDIIKTETKHVTNIMEILAALA